MDLGDFRELSVLESLFPYSLYRLFTSLLGTDIPIPGCRSVERVEENARGAEITLSPEDVNAIRALSEAADVQGERYPPFYMKQVEGNCIPLSEWKGQRVN